MPTARRSGVRPRQAPGVAGVVGSVASSARRTLARVTGRTHPRPAPAPAPEPGPAPPDPDLATIDDLIRFYDRLRRRFAAAPPRSRAAAGRPPTTRDVGAVETAVLASGPFETFARVLLADADPGRAAVACTRELLGDDTTARARAFSQALQRDRGTRAPGEVCQALVAMADRVPSTAWALFARQDSAEVARLVPTEFLRLAFRHDRPLAVDVLDRLLLGDLPAAIRPAGWLEIARVSFAAGAEEQSRAALDRAEGGLRGLADRGRAERMGRDVEALRGWLGRRAAALAAPPAPPGEIPFAVIDYKQPDRRVASVNLGDPIQTLASLGHLVRRSGLRFTGDPGLVAVTEELRDRVRPDHVVDGDVATVRLHTIDRDASSWSSVPPGTWTVVFGWFMHPIFGMRVDIPLNPNVRPLVVSLHIDAVTMLTEDTVEYLRRYGPIGCRDWNTVSLLLAADVPAFFSGCLTTTIDTLVPDDPSAQPSGTLYVDIDGDGPGETFAHGHPEVQERSLADNLRDALRRVTAYRDTYAHVVTSRLHCYLPARAVGGSVDFRPRNPADARFDGLAGIDEGTFDAMRAGIRDILSAALGAIAAGRSEAEVYATWRQACAPAVADARSRCTELPEIAPPSFDVPATCARIRCDSVAIDRSAPGPDGTEIVLELTVEGPIAHEAEVLLDSAVARCSRPLRAVMLTRGHRAEDRVRLARRFPTVSFAWLAMDGVCYDSAPTAAPVAPRSLDRLLLPELLPDVSRVVHLDLDTLCLADLAALHDTDLAGRPVAARTALRPEGSSGFVSIIRASTRLRQRQDLARELIRRTHSRLRFDFAAFHTGVAVLNLDRMRSDDFCRRFLPYAERFGLNCQEVLNAYAGADRASLDRRWNTLVCSEVVDGPRVIHWEGALEARERLWVACRGAWDEAEQRYRARIGSDTPA